ncbi:hypothetical protein C4587_01880 [Candidatus Parcubacteria bacterium]|nr:MAG: hypothetical protein C4587_01880 [Candidatus Parcubacteria bacterium]
MKRLCTFFLILLLFGCGSNPFNPQPTGDPLIDTAVTVSNAAKGAVNAAPDFVASGDLSQADADWIAENAPPIIIAADALIAVASGNESGDPIAKYDAIISALDLAIQNAPNERVETFLRRGRGGVVFWRSALEASLTK